jgi:lipoprotein signal peptidase
MVRIRLALGVAFVIAAIDQWTKYLGRVSPEWDGAFWFIEKNLFLNEGIAFGIPFPRWLFWIAAGIVMSMLLRVFLRTGAHPYERFALVALFIGAASNMIDRLRFGGVVDIFALPGGLTFNIADCMIIAGLVSFFILVHFRSSVCTH